MGVALLVPYIAGFWNIGGQGQYIFGAIFATWLGLRLSGVPAEVAVPLIFVFGFFGGALWALPPTLMKMSLGVSEVITTVMMNFIAVFFLNYVVIGPMEGEQAKAFHSPASDPVPKAFQLPSFYGTTLTWGLVVALAVAVVAFFVLKYARYGYELRIIGANQEVARYAGIQIKKDVLVAMIISGGLAGVAGLVEVYGTTTVLLPQVFSDITTSFGYIGIPVALIAYLNPIVTIFSSIFLSGILIGSYSLEQTYGIPIDVVTAIYGLIMLFAMIGVYGSFGKFWRRKK